MARRIRNLFLIFTCWLVLSYGGSFLQFWSKHKNDPQIERIQVYLESAADAGIEWMMEQTVTEGNLSSSDQESSIPSPDGT